MLVLQVKRDERGSRAKPFGGLLSQFTLGESRLSPCCLQLLGNHFPLLPFVYKMSQSVALVNTLANLALSLPGRDEQRTNRGSVVPDSGEAWRD